MVEVLGVVDLLGDRGMEAVTRDKKRYSTSNVRAPYPLRIRLELLLRKYLGFAGEVISRLEFPYRLKIDGSGDFSPGADDHFS